jgi:hypothetical protein
MGQQTKAIIGQFPIQGPGRNEVGNVAWFDDDGFLCILERKKDIIVSAGVKASARDFEDVARWPLRFNFDAHVKKRKGVFLAFRRATVGSGAGTGIRVFQIFKNSLDSGFRRRDDYLRAQKFQKYKNSKEGFHELQQN